MTEEEWAYFEPFLIHRGGRPPRDHRRVLDAVFWLMRTGAPWRDLPEEFGNWNSIFRQFRRWADSSVWDVILQALAGSGVCDATLQMFDLSQPLEIFYARAKAWCAARWPNTMALSTVGVPSVCWPAKKMGPSGLHATRRGALFRSSRPLGFRVVPNNQFGVGMIMLCPHRYTK